MQCNNVSCVTTEIGPFPLTLVDNICTHTVSLKNLNPCLLMMAFTSQWSQMKKDSGNSKHKATFSA